MIDPLQASVQIASSGLEAQSTQAARRFGEFGERKFHRPDPGIRALPAQNHDVHRGNGSRGRRSRREGQGHRRRPRSVPASIMNRATRRPSPDGYVKLPNVNSLIEMADMRETNRSFEANLQVIKQARSMVSMTIDLLRGA